MYVKPKNYKPEKRYSNTWYFANLEKPACQQVWEAGMGYYDKLKKYEKRPGNRTKHPVQLIKYFFFLFLAGKRLREPVNGNLSIKMVNSEETYADIEALNEKHKDPQGNPAMAPAAIPIFDTWEQLMWDFITDGNLTLNAEDMFKFQEWRSLKKDNLSHLIKRNFKIDLKDTVGDVHRNCGITPHILRHMRCFNVLINHNTSPELAIIWFGWNDQRMVYYYAHIRNMLTKRNQLEMLRARKLLTNLRVDSGMRALQV